MVKDELINKVFRSYLCVSILGVLAATIGMLVDGIVIGRFLGSECVSAFGLASPIFILVAALAGIFSNGGTSICANHIGRGEPEKIRLNFTVTCLATFVIGVIITLVCLMMSKPLAVFLGAEDSLIELTSAYIKGIGAGGIVIMLSQVIMYYVRMDNDSILGFVSVVFMTIVNIGLDILFGIILKWGMIGMGFATSISYAVSLLVCLVHFSKKTNTLKLTGFTGGMQELRDVLFSGIPSALNRACLTIRGIVLNHLLMTLGGSLAVSALAVQNNINQVLSSITMGVGMTVMLIAGIFYGERDEAALGRTLRVSIRTGLVISAVTAVLVVLFAHPLVGLFLSGNEQGMQLAVRSLRMFALSLPFSLICVALIYFYQSSRNLWMANLICTLHGLLFVVFFAFLLSNFVGLDGVWISFFLAETATLITTTIIAYVKKKRFPKRMEDIMLLPEDFNPQKERVLDITLQNDMEQAMELSRRVSEFCGKYSDDKEKIEKLSLCIEEMVGNIILHGFSDKKTHYIDIKIIMKEESIILRIRDNGMTFNPLEKETTEEQLGIRIIRKLAKEIDYKNAVGMNNLMIVL